MTNAYPRTVEFKINIFYRQTRHIVCEPYRVFWIIVMLFYINRSTADSFFVLFCSNKHFFFFENLNNICDLEITSQLNYNFSTFLFEIARGVYDKKGTVDGCNEKENQIRVIMRHVPPLWSRGRGRRVRAIYY